MENGHVAIHRLNEIKTSLDRSLDLVRSEFEQRSYEMTYRETYLTELRELQHQTSILEDRIRRAL